MKITIAFLALFAVAANAAVDIEPFAPAFEQIEPAATSRQSWVLFVNRIRKEIKGLIEEFDQCNSYESDALKGTCFTHWSLRLASDIKQFVEAIKNWSDDEVIQSRDSTIILINKVRKEVLGLIDEFEQCNSYESDALKGTCFTHWSLRFANDIKEIVEYFTNNASEDLAQSRSATSVIILVNKLRKEIEGLINEFNQCNAYESDALKGTCFTHWSLRLASDIKQLVEGIIELANGGKRSSEGWEITKDVFRVIALVTKDVKDLIALFDECDSYISESRKGLCFTRFALAIVYDLYELVTEIIDIVNSSSLQIVLLDNQYETYETAYMQDY